MFGTQVVLRIGLGAVALTGAMAFTGCGGGGSDGADNAEAARPTRPRQPSSGTRG